MVSALRRLAHRLPPEQRRFVKFALVGGSGVVVNVGVVWLLQLLFDGMLPERIDLGPLGTPTGAKLEEAAALVGGILVSIFTNFIINDRWTWGDRDKTASGGWLTRCLRFYLTNGIAASLQFGAALLTVRFWPFASAPFGWDPGSVRVICASLVGIAVATPLNYVVNNIWTFRDRVGPTE